MTCCHGAPLESCTVAHCVDQRWRARVDTALDMLIRASLADGKHLAGLSRAVAEIRAQCPGVVKRRARVRR